MTFFVRERDWASLVAELGTAVRFSEGVLDVVNTALQY